MVKCSPEKASSSDIVVIKMHFYSSLKNIPEHLNIHLLSLGLFVVCRFSTRINTYKIKAFFCRSVCAAHARGFYLFLPRAAVEIRAQGGGGVGAVLHRRFFPDISIRITRLSPKSG